LKKCSEGHLFPVKVTAYLIDDGIGPPAQNAILSPLQPFAARPTFPVRVNYRGYGASPRSGGPPSKRICRLRVHFLW
jgi:uncharacterized RDD family membrane protein YckC